MNKYEKELGFIVDASEADVMCSHVKSNLLGAIDTLRELVKRATPMKVNLRRGISLPSHEVVILEKQHCPKCGEMLYYDSCYDFCPHCGQALDWSEEK